MSEIYDNVLNRTGKGGFEILLKTSAVKTHRQFQSESNC